MTFRSLAIAVAGLLLAAAHPPPPAALGPYIKDGQFDPGDFGWMRGAFDDASEQEKADFLAITAWTDECLANPRPKSCSSSANAAIPTREPS